MLNSNVGCINNVMLGYSLAAKRNIRVTRSKMSMKYHSETEFMNQLSMWTERPDLIWEQSVKTDWEIYFKPTKNNMENTKEKICFFIDIYIYFGSNILREDNVEWLKEENLRTGIQSVRSKTCYISQFIIGAAGATKEALIWYLYQSQYCRACGDYIRRALDWQLDLLDYKSVTHNQSPLSLLQLQLTLTTESLQGSGPPAEPTGAHWPSTNSSAL
jgi:hypothetical protein